MITEFKPLSVGDVRKRGDQTRLHYMKCRNFWEKPEEVITEWEEVNLFGWSILPSDLFNAEFRRPLI